MYCKKCGKKLPDDARFCNSCGAIQKPQEAINATETKNLKTKKIMLILLVVIIILILICAIKHYTKGEVQLIGKWDVFNKKVSGGDVSYYVSSGDIAEFCKDGTFLFNDNEGYYNVLSNDKLIIEINGEKYSCKYKLEWKWNGKHDLTLKSSEKKLRLVKLKN